MVAEKLSLLLEKTVLGVFRALKCEKADAKGELACEECVGHPGGNRASVWGE